MGKESEDAIQHRLVRRNRKEEKDTRTLVKSGEEGARRQS
jgi:ribose 1,5-bisphosphokinase PhnN